MELELSEILDSRDIIDHVEKHGHDDYTLTIFEECSGYSDWEYGETLIREDYLPEWAEEFVTDCYGLPRELPSWIVIDWQETAENLVEWDYMSVDVGDYTYYMRAI